MNCELVQRYASAFFQVALKKNAFPKLAREIEEVLEQVLQPIHPFYHFLANPTVKLPYKAKIIDALSGFFSPLLCDLMLFLVKKNRGSLLAPVLHQVLFDYDQAYHIEDVELVLASPVAPKERRMLEEVAKKITQAKEVNLHIKHDRSILGGCIWRTKTHQLDASLRAKIAHLEVLWKRTLSVKTL